MHNGARPEALWWVVHEDSRTKSGIGQMQGVVRQGHAQVQMPVVLDTWRTEEQEQHKAAVAAPAVVGVQWVWLLAQAPACTAVGLVLAVVAADIAAVEAGEQLLAPVQV